MDAQESERENEQSARDAANEAAASLWSVNGERLRFIDPEEFTDEILLSLVDGVGSITTDRLLTRFGSATNVLDAPLDELQRVDKVGPTLAHKIAQA
ncbi:MAG: hypothetical protein IKX88_09220, partial [Thermoguttaceae bacterium]|nr:hypothetical protein [Thermoguttaceae bacterium]